MRWISPNKAMILMSLRGKAEDKFWFSFFHEAGHVYLQHSKKELYINDGAADDPLEKEADEFAAECLIPRVHNPSVESIRSKDEVLALAARLGISPGIVAGRYQFLTNKWDFYKPLIRKFEWKPVQKGSN